MVIKCNERLMNVHILKSIDCMHESQLVMYFYCFMFIHLYSVLFTNKRDLNQ